MKEMFRRLNASFTHNLLNIPGWRTPKRIVVIESDDWGSIRMPSNEVYSKLVSKGYDISRSDYNRLDTLESNDDLSMLFEVLKSHKDCMGNFPVITANMIVGNPDFIKIRQSDFSEYHFEPVIETLKRYPGRDSVVFLWNTGNKEKIFHPQFHGREHVNVVRWMEALNKRTPKILFTFECNTTFSGDGDYNFMEVLDFNTPDDLIKMKESLTEGLNIFEDIFGYRSKSFIPPCYTWNSEVEKVLHQQGVMYIQGLVVQSIPTGSFGNYKKKYHYLGKRNQFGQCFLIRNAFFEPSLTKLNDSIGECLRRIEIAFRWKKPAIISSHRINYVGALNEENRRNNLKLLDELLRRILNKWPDVEFMTSDQLGEMISDKDKLKA